MTQLRSAYGDTLRAVVLYGSAVAGERVARHSDYNVLVIVSEVPLARLRELSAVTRSWRNDGNPAPMTFTEREWRASADVFPMEYADILERHKVLFGSAPFDGVTVDPQDLRLQVEHETMGVLLRLRNAMLAAGVDAGEQLNLMTASLSSLMIVFRAVLRLHHVTPPQSYADLVAETARATGMDPAPFLEVVGHARATATIPKERAGAVLAAYLQGMERVATHVDALPHPSH
ncbi:MAG TPA: hypothetical protein VGT98_18340 [Candidatus Elarobacter sp.]|nr:hypothetical protein [Candidatus Elarobacter sp.]